MTLGERIRSIRESKGITQNTLAESVHVTSSYISRIEHGSSLPSLDLIQSIAEALDTPVQDIRRYLYQDAPYLRQQGERTGKTAYDKYVRGQ